MLLDANDLSNGTILRADVCIVGAGAAGITMALELRGSGLSVLLLESGGLQADDATSDLYDGTLSGLSGVGLQGCRNRFFGGTTATWAGWCRALDPDDFTKRPWLQGSGWPFGYEEFVPYFARAQRTLEAGAFEYDVQAISQRLGTPIFPLDESRVRSVVYQYSAPLRMGSGYRDELDESQEVEVHLHANLVDIRLVESGEAVGQLSCATLSGVRFQVEAQHYVLAMGGIEIPRIMLASNSQQSAGVGNANDLVGRYFMEHPHLYRGAHFLTDGLPDATFYHKRHTVSTSDQENPDGISTRVQGGLSVAPQVREAEGLTTFGATLGRVNPDGHDGKTGELDARVVDSILRNSTGQVELYRMDIRAEQRPNPDSRVTLGEETDALGMRRVDVNWVVTDEDLENVRRSLEIIGAELGRAGIGRMWIPLKDDGTYRNPRIAAGCHHMGTTRMSTSASDGVVDADCKVHGLDNLYICGASVFPTGGFANPMLTAVALAHRLADHIQEVAS